MSLCCRVCVCERSYVAGVCCGGDYKPAVAGGAVVADAALTALGLETPAPFCESSKTCDHQ